MCGTWHLAKHFHFVSVPSQQSPKVATIIRATEALRLICPWWPRKWQTQACSLILCSFVESLKEKEDRVPPAIPLCWIHFQLPYLQPEVTETRRRCEKERGAHVPETTSLERTIENLKQWQKYLANRHSLHIQRAYQWSRKTCFESYNPLFSFLFHSGADRIVSPKEKWLLLLWAFKTSFWKSFLMDEEATELGKGMCRGTERSLQHAWGVGSWRSSLLMHRPVCTWQCRRVP